MKIFKTIHEVQSFISYEKSNGKTVGFVPTMGALHLGHLSLIQMSMQQNDITIASIFVNPIQFNDPKDYEKYPRILDLDCEMLAQEGCSAVFIPSVSEMYPDTNMKKYDFGSLETVMEGSHRPGHFNGVAVVVSKLFDIVKPDQAYFGEKDFQQLRIIQKLVEIENLKIKIIAGPTLRENDGLAMSSRNMRLTSVQRFSAAKISKTLLEAKKMKTTESVTSVKEWVISEINRCKDLKVEYFEIADELNLIPLNNWEESLYPRGFIAVFCGEVRLIDNIRLF